MNKTLIRGNTSHGCKTGFLLELMTDLDLDVLVSRRCLEQTTQSAAVLLNRDDDKDTKLSLLCLFC